MTETETRRNVEPNEFGFEMPREMAGMFNLMVHPTAGLAAASAIGLGLATQAMGLWFGAVAGAMETALRATEKSAPRDRAREKPSAAAQKASAAAKTLIDEAHSLAREVSETPAPAAARPKPRPVAAKPGKSGREVSMSRPAALERPDQPDDLKAISGIGPKLEQVLNGLGIWTYAQIAAWTSAEIAWVDDQLGFAGRIGRDAWTSQAARLANASGR